MGNEVVRSSEAFHLSKQKYLNLLLEKAQLFEENLMSTPFLGGKTMSNTDGQALEDRSHFRSMIGTLQY